MEHNSAQELLWLVRHSQKQGFIAGVIVSAGVVAAAKTVKTYSFSMRKRAITRVS